MGNLALAAGITLLAAGGGLWWLSYQGQEEAARQWEEIGTPSVEATPAITALPDGGAMVRMWIPRLGKEEYVIKGATSRNLKRGPAWLVTTSPPGGEGNCVIAGHRDTHFRFLKDVRAGDVIELKYGKRVFRYAVEAMHIVKPSNRQYLRPAGNAVLTLVTCYPFYYVGPAPKRYIVRAVLVQENNASKTDSIRG